MKSFTLHLCQNTDILYIGFDFVKRFLFSLFVFSYGLKVGLKKSPKRELVLKCSGNGDISGLSV